MLGDLNLKIYLAIEMNLNRTNTWQITEVSNSPKRHADYCNSGSAFVTYELKQAYFWIILALEASALLKIPPYNTTWSALRKHEWSNKKGWETEQRKANVQINVRGA